MPPEGPPRLRAHAGGVVRRNPKLQNGQSVTVDESYLRESIVNPQAKIAAGFQPVMPPYQGRVNEEQIIELIAYIKALGQAGAGESSVARPGAASGQQTPGKAEVSRR